MAITETRALPAQFIEDLGTDYAKQLKAATAVPLDTTKFAPSVAPQTALQQQATALTGLVLVHINHMLQQQDKQQQQQEHD